MKWFGIANWPIPSVYRVSCPYIAFHPISRKVGTRWVQTQSLENYESDKAPRSP
jgi:hypothetical protein